MRPFLQFRLAAIILLILLVHFNQNAAGRDRFDCLTISLAERGLLNIDP